MYAAGYSIRPLRSTRRGSLRHLGRWAIVIAAVGCVSVGLSKAVLGDGQAVDATVVVQPGDTLWAIAAEHYPADDVRVRVDEIERLNRLSGPKIEVGDTLQLPA
jgi:nucleoid-associated protein YgaU